MNTPSKKLLLLALLAAISTPAFAGADAKLPADLLGAVVTAVQVFLLRAQLALQRGRRSGVDQAIELALGQLALELRGGIAQAQLLRGHGRGVVLLVDQFEVEHREAAQASE